MSKKELLKKICVELETQITTLVRALGENLDSSTGQEGRSEGKYDTRATETAYLAEAQKKQLVTQRDTLATLQKFTPPAFSADDSISLGALVEVEEDDDIVFYLLAPVGGGLNSTILGCPATLISPSSPLFQTLLDKKIGDAGSQNDLLILGVQ